MFLDRFLFELSCKNTHTQTQRDSNEYSIVVFSKNATITSRFLLDRQNSLVPNGPSVSFDVLVSFNKNRNLRYLLHLRGISNC